MQPDTRQGMHPDTRQGMHPDMALLPHVIPGACSRVTKQLALVRHGDTCNSVRLYVRIRQVGRHVTGGCLLGEHVVSHAYAVFCPRDQGKRMVCCLELEGHVQGLWIWFRAHGLSAAAGQGIRV